MAQSSFNEFLTNNLNEEQQQAVLQKSGAILVSAGAGSGKTRVITARITNLIVNEHALPQSIVALTFTNKAAKEMQERVHTFLDNTQGSPWIGTFHSYCLQLLKAHPELLETPFFSILDEDDQQKLLKSILKQQGLVKEISPKDLSWQISRIKNYALDTETVGQLYQMNPLLHQLYNAYEQEKRASRCLDFDDLLLDTLTLFSRNPEFKKEHQEKINHILVDEYQDTNVVQHELLKHMAKKNAKELGVESICIVGDEDQSIYSWRGATVTNILNIQKDFPKTVTVKIEQNYRSAQPILEAANAVIINNKQRNPKKLWSAKKGSDRIRALACLSEYQEADAIANAIKVAKSIKKNTTIALLYRTHFQSRALEEALLKHSIAYTIIGGVQFYERAEIKDLLAYLRLLVNPFDHASFFRIINTPQRGLGEKSEELFFSLWHTEPFLTFIDLIKKVIEQNLLPHAKLEALEQFLTIFEGLSATDNPSQALEKILLRTGYLGYLKTAYEAENAQERNENIKELLNAMAHFELNGINTIDKLLDEVALMQENIHKKKDDPTTVKLMTYHAAKGLEFDFVALVGLEDGLMPSLRAEYASDKLEEERRLFYVGITRAKERLLLSYARYRYGYRNMTDQVASRFLEEIPKNLIPMEDCSYWRQPQMVSYFAQWFGARTQSYTPSTVFTFGTRAPVTEGPNTNTESITLESVPTHSFAESTRIENKYTRVTEQSHKGKPGQTHTHKSKNKKNAKPTSSVDKLKKAIASLTKPTPIIREPKNPSFSTPFKKNSPVMHPTFGAGVVQEVETKVTGKVIVTVLFKASTKKIDAQFLNPV
jgi:DNA helicase-2/ATP-dependent DNA helicase PcrA